MIADVEVEADSLDEAIEKANDIPLEEINAEYCDSSFSVNRELAFELYPE